MCLIILFYTFKRKLSFAIKQENSQIQNNNLKAMKYFTKLTIATLLGVIMLSSVLTAQVNMDRYITLTVKNGQSISLVLAADANATPIKIVSGDNTYDITVGTNFKSGNYIAGSTTMTIYGNIFFFDCQLNGQNVNGFLDASHNTALTYLECQNNSLSSLDVSGCTALTLLWCYKNNLGSLNVSNNTALKDLVCSSNNLSSLDVSQNTALIWLDCSNNSLSSLDVSHNTALTGLNCGENNLSSLDVSHCTDLTRLICYSNPFSTDAVDALFCSLPDREVSDSAKVYILNNTDDANYANVIASNKQNALDKNWKVWYCDNWIGSLHNTDIPATTGDYDCDNPPVNMDRYITLTVQSGEDISLRFAADADNTPVKIVSGDEVYDIMVGTSWTGFQNYTAGSTTMTIYGDLDGFDCRNNGDKLTGLDALHNTALKVLWCYDNNLSSLDVSQNTALIWLICSGNNLSSLDVSQNTSLKYLKCYGNPFSADAVDALFCSLPQRAVSDGAKLYILDNTSDANHADVLASNKQNAIAKNWKVWYWDNYSGSLHDTDIPATTGSYVCPVPEPNMERYITLTVQQGQSIQLDLWADADNTPVKIVSGDQVYNIIVDDYWTDFQYYTAGSSTMTVYGDIKKFDCNNNENNVSGLDISHNMAIETLSCKGNNLSSLDVSQNAALTELNCHTNNLSSLDVSQNTALKMLSCRSNNLSSLDVSNNTALKKLYCHGNNFTTEALDLLYCSLPDRSGLEAGWIEPIYNSSSANYSTVMASNKQNAIDKNWAVKYYSNDTNIPETTGNYECPDGINTIENNETITLYPNPVSGLLNIESSTAIHKIEVFNFLGQLIDAVNINNNSYQYHTEKLNVGYYMFKIHTNNGIAVEKVMKR